VVDYVPYVAGGWMLFPSLGFWIAGQKGRWPFEGLFLGLLFGPFGCLIEALMPNVQPSAPASADGGAKVESAAQMAEARRRREEEAVRQGKLGLAEWQELSRAQDEWLVDTVLKFGWVRSLPEAAQAIVWGLLIALPVAVAMIVLLSRMAP